MMNDDRDPGLDRLYGAAPRDEPPARLDAAIQAAARREVGARPRPLSALRRWRVPVSIAAVLVLSASLVMLMKEEGGHDLLMQPGPGDFARPAEAPAPPSPGARDAPDARVFERNMRGSAAPAPQPAAKGSTAAGAARAPEPPAGTPSAAPTLDQPASMPSPSAAEMASGVVLGPLRSAPAPELRKERDAPATAADDVARRAVQSQGAGSAVAPAPVAPPPFAEARPAAPQPPQARAAPKLAQRSDERYGELGVLREGAPVQLASVVVLVKELDKQPPEKWLAQIQGLRRQGRLAEAEELTAEFKRRFPAHPVPSGLQ